LAAHPQAPNRCANLQTWINACCTMTNLSYQWIHRPLLASLCELRPDKSLESQPPAHRAYPPFELWALRVGSRPESLRAGSCPGGRSQSAGGGFNFQLRPAKKQRDASKGRKLKTQLINPPVKRSFTNSPLRTFSHNPLFHNSIVPLFPPGLRPYGPEANCERSEPVYGFLPPNSEISAFR
jgi:hypothetical protein